MQKKKEEKRIYVRRVLKELPKCFLCRHTVINRGNENMVLNAYDRVGESVKKKKMTVTNVNTKGQS